MGGRRQIRQTPSFEGRRKALLKEDEVQTILVEVEAVLNSRPLVADSSNPNDGEAITPAHFLVGTTLAALPPGSAPPYPDDDLTHLQRWQLISGIKRRFWRDWSRDYIAGPQQRVNWTKESEWNTRNHRRHQRG